MQALYESSITSGPRLHKGKVRDIYALGDAHMLIVTSDRLSAFDVILPQPIPGKGAVLTAVSNFWMARFTQLLRSEDHTSELQSLMRISYAVFCLKKKKHKHQVNQLRHKNTKHNTRI